MQISKSLLIKCLSILCIICCALALVFGISACSDGQDGAPGPKGDTGATGPKGDDGAPGEDGEDGENGIGIKDAYIDEETGHLILVKDDETTIDAGEVPGYNGSADVEVCEHEWYLYPLDVATCTKPGAVLAVCITEHEEADGTVKTGCGYAEIQFTDVDPDNHNYVVDTVVEPTCVSGGYTVMKCSDCDDEQYVNYTPATEHVWVNPVTTAPTCTQNGYITYSCGCTSCVSCSCTLVFKHGETDTVSGGVVNLPATGHAEEEDAIMYPVVEEGNNICEDGGQILWVCPNCKEYVYKSETVEALGHQVDGTWAWIVEPTTEEGGILSGYCEICKTTATITTPVLSEQDYVKTVDKVATCDEAGQVTYTYLAGRNSYPVDVIVPVTAQHQLLISATGLKLPVNTDLVNNPTIYNLEDLGEKGVDYMFPANIPANCLETGIIMFTCADCGETYALYVRGAHVTTGVLDHKDSTCTEQGYTIYECSVCGSYTSYLPLAPHTYGDPEVTGNETDGYVLTFTCSVCGHEETYNALTYNKNEELSVPADCAQAGKDVYDYTYLDEDGEEVEGQITIVLAQKSHYVGNHEFDVTNPLLPTAPTYEYDDLEDIVDQFTEASNIPVDCSTEGIVFFVCDGCGEIYSIKVRGHHDYKLVSTTPATCEDDAVEHWVCANDEAHVKDEPVEGSALGHDYVYTKVYAEDGVTVTGLNVTCTRCDFADYIEGTNFAIDEANSVAPTCDAVGYEVWTFDYVDLEGVTQQGTYTIELGKTQHYVLTELNEEGRYYFDDTNPLSENAITYELDNYPDYANFITEASNIPTDCLNVGPVFFVCENCGTTIAIKVRGTHEWSEWKTVDATCTEDGYTYRVCSVCLEVEYDETLATPATGHSWTYVETKATEEAEGKVVATCAYCGKVETAVLPVLNGTNYTIESDTSSCISDGYVTYSYTVTLSDGTKHVVTTLVEKAATGEHEDSGIYYRWFKDGYTYVGYLCKNADHVVTISKEMIVLEPNVANRDQITLTNSDGEYTYWGVLDLEIGATYEVVVNVSSRYAQADSVSATLILNYGKVNENGEHEYRYVPLNDIEYSFGTYTIGIAGAYPGSLAGIKSAALEVTIAGIPVDTYFSVMVQEVITLSIGENEVDVVDGWNGVELPFTSSNGGTYVFSTEAGSDSGFNIDGSFTVEEDGSYTPDSDSFYHLDWVYGGGSVTINLEAGETVTLTIVTDSGDAGTVVLNIEKIAGDPEETEIPVSPVDPTPVDPTPVDPTPVDPDPVEPDDEEEPAPAEPVVQTLNIASLDANATLTDEIELTVGGEGTGFYAGAASEGKVKVADTQNKLTVINFGGSAITSDGYANYIKFTVGAGKTTINVSYFNGNDGRYLSLSAGVDNVLATTENNPTTSDKAVVLATITVELAEETTLYLGSYSSGIYLTALEVTTVA